MGELDGVEDDESSEGEVVNDESESEESSDGDEDRKYTFPQACIFRSARCMLDWHGRKRNGRADLHFVLRSPPVSQTCMSTRPPRTRTPSRQHPSLTCLRRDRLRRTRSLSRTRACTRCSTG